MLRFCNYEKIESKFLTITSENWFNNFNEENLKECDNLKFIKH